jgi:hypothetical protein
LTRLVARRPWTAIAVGETIEARGKRVRIANIECAVVRRRRLFPVDVVEHRLLLTTQALPAANVIDMPVAAPSFVADFLRYHVLVRVYDGDPDAWLAHLARHGGDDGDVRFLRSVRARLRREPELLDTIRRMVDTTRFWSATSVR